MRSAAALLVFLWAVPAWAQSPAPASAATPTDAPPAPIASAPNAPNATTAAPASSAPSSASPSAAPSSAPSAAPPANAVLIDAYPNGVDPAAATFVTGVLRDTLGRLGYSLVPTARLYETARAVSLPFPPQADAVAYLMRLLAVPIAVTCEVRGGGGYYQAIVRVRFAQEPSERVRQVLATQWTLGDSLRAAMPSMLAPPTAYSYGAYGNGVPPSFAGYTPPPPRPATRLHPNPFDLAVGLEFAFGPGSDAFFNFLGYGRVAWFPVDRFGITASASYANLRGRNDRVSSVLLMGGIETAVDLIPAHRIYLPLRVEAGYLVRNGPVGRATLGIGWGLSRDVRVEFDLLSPTIWAAQGGAATSLDLGVQLIVGLGAAPPPPPQPPPTPHHRHRHHRPSAAPSDAPSEAPSPAPTP